MQPSSFFGKLRPQGMRQAVFDNGAIGGIDECDGKLSAEGHGKGIRL
jgi:hypothetical protein